MITAFINMENQSSAAMIMTASALAMSRLKDVSIILMESGFGTHQVEDALVGHAGGMVAEPFAYMDGEGLDYLIKRSRHNMLCEKTVGGGIVYVKNTLGYVPSAMKRNQAMYEMEFGRECENIITQLNKVANYVFIDCSGSSDTIRVKILKQADLVVVNTTQSAEILDEYFSCLPFYCYKSLYCIGNYISEEPFNLKNIQRLYRIGNRQIGMIPYNVEFLSAMHKGKILPFFENRPMRLRYHRNRHFFYELSKMADLILNWEGCGLEKGD